MNQKFILSVIVFVLAVSVATAQVKYSSTGNFGIGSSNPTSLFTFGDDGYTSTTFNIYSSGSSFDRGLRIHHYPNSADYNYATLSSLRFSSQGWKLAGIYSAAHRDTYTAGVYTYGIIAYAGRGTEGLNYGVYGKLIGDQDGAGVFGADSYNTEQDTDGDYAGFFAGDLHVTGNITYVGTCTDVSDINLKKDISIVSEDVLKKLSGLQTIKYTLKHPSEYSELSDTISSERIEQEKQLDAYTRTRIGLIAQELEIVFPEVVKEDQQGYLGVNYAGLVPILVKAINQQQAQIEELKASLKNGAVEKSAIEDSFDGNDIIEEAARISQNMPNPFNEETTIRYNIPRIESKAQINIYDLQGKQIRTYQIISKGEGEITIPASDLSSGIYIYNLIVDSREFDTKRMILTE